MREELAAALAAFAAERGIQRKGSLSVALTVTRRAIADGLPLDPEALLTKRKGQASGLGGAAVHKILKDYGIVRVLAAEGGRTSRGSIENTRAYADALNSWHASGILPFGELSHVEAWWIERVLEFFNRQPFVIKPDPALSLRVIVGEIFAQAEKRQKEGGGQQYVGGVLHYMVGAKLSLFADVRQRAFSVADSASGQMGDYDMGSLSIHVTTHPSEALLRKCQDNLTTGRTPVIVTRGTGVGGGASLAEALGIVDRVEIWDADQFLAANLYEAMLRRGEDHRGPSLEILIARYNEIIDQVESDPSFRIESKHA